MSSSNSKKPKVGDTVQYYCLTSCNNKLGVVTAVDVPVVWLRGNPLGIEIDRSVTRAYGGLESFAVVFGPCPRDNGVSADDHR